MTRELRRNAKAASPAAFTGSASTSALRELLALARLVETDLLALHLACVTRDEPGFRQRGLQRRVVVDQRARDAVAHCARLAGFAAAFDVDHDVERGFMIGELQWLADHHAPGVAREEHVGGLFVDDDGAGALLQEHASNGALAAARAVIVVADHEVRCPVFWVAAPNAGAQCRRST